jgi:3-hydroxyisobutyrate dehydrogenase-like beta-hydroxyacid dehydrogenase
MSNVIGFIGLGSMGLPMAQNVLKAGYALRVYNRDARKAAPLLQAGATLVQQPQDVVTPGGIVITMVADDTAIAQVTTGPDGFLKHLGPHGIHISMSTVSPTIARQMEQLHIQHECSYIGAPVFGRPDAAAAAKLWLLMAGNTAAKERVRPLISSMGQKIFDFGEQAENANIAKVSGNFLMLAAAEAISETLTMAEKHGVDRVQLMNMFTQTLFGCTTYQNFGKRIAARDFTEVSFQMQLALKDVDLMLDASRRAQSPMPFASILHDRLLTGIARGRAEHESLELARVSDENAGLE